MAGPHQIVEHIPMSRRPTVASNGSTLRASRGAAPGAAPAAPVPNTASLRTTVTAAKLAHRRLARPRWLQYWGEQSGAAVATRAVTLGRMNRWAILAGYGLLAG